MNDNDNTEKINRTVPEMFARLFWMLLGPMLFVPLTFKLIEYGNGWATKFDIAFLGMLVALCLARMFEHYKGHPLTAEGEPATKDHLRRYALGVAVVGLAVWVTANVLGNYVFAGRTTA